jgi:hypothetical protein
LTFAGIARIAAGLKIVRVIVAAVIIQVVCLD